MHRLQFRTARERHASDGLHGLRHDNHCCISECRYQTSAVGIVEHLGFEAERFRLVVKHLAVEFYKRVHAQLLNQGRNAYRLQRETACEGFVADTLHGSRNGYVLEEWASPESFVADFLGVFSHGVDTFDGLLCSYETLAALRVVNAPSVVAYVLELLHSKVHNLFLELVIRLDAHFQQS